MIKDIVQSLTIFIKAGRHGGRGCFLDFHLLNLYTCRARILTHLACIFCLIPPNCIPLGDSDNHSPGRAWLIRWRVRLDTNEGKTKSSLNFLSTKLLSI
jgi:hypothetical protein